MLNVMLISMPYTILTMPSIGIAQVQAVTHRQMPGQVKVDSAYCYLDFAEFVGGLEQYDTIGTYESKGLHDWLFRQAAFDIPDNFDSYRTFYYSDGNFPRKRKIFDVVAEKRKQVNEFLDRLIERYKLRDYQVVGFTSMMSQNVSSFALARRLKQLNPNVITCMGGPNTEHPMGKTIAENVPQIDYVFSGEALVNFPAFLQAVIAKDYGKMAALKGVHSNFYVEARQVSGGEAGMSFAGVPIAVNPKTKGTGTKALEDNSGDAFNMNEMPMLDYSAYLERIEQSPYRDKLQPELIITFQTSTGCWWADKVPCSFCGLTPHSFRQMNSQKAKEYIGELIDRYKGKFSVFEATDPCMPVEYPKEVFPFVNQDKAVILQYEVKAKMPQDDMIEMAKANVILPQPGIESLSTRTLKIMRKGVTAFHNVQFLKYCTEHGLYPIWNYLYGFPNSNYDELETGKLVSDIQALCHLPPPSSNVPIAFQRYAEYFNDRDKYGLKLRPLDQYFYIYPWDEAVIAEMAYSFIDQEYSENLFAKNAQAIQAINVEVVNWMFKFREDIPKLYFSDELVIYDTRSEKPAKYRIGRTEREVLRFLNEPRTVEEVAEQFKLPIEEAQKMLQQFSKARFLFSERDKHMNIVCDRCALTADIYKNYYVNFVKNSSNAFD